MTLPKGGSGVRVRIRWLTRQVLVEYAGTAADLVAARVATDGLLASAHSTRLQARADGDEFSVARTANGDRIVVSHWTTHERALAMPGVAALIETCKDEIGDSLTGWLAEGDIRE